MPNFTNVVQQTTDYEQFNFLGANRDIHKPHVEALKKSIETLGNITEKVPIIVNENFAIIDGQHRFEALKELGLPVFFIVAPGMGVHQARSMNTLNKSWRPEDYAKSYAAEGNQNYTAYNDLRETYPSFSHSSLLVAVFEGRTRGVYKDFREGRFVLHDIGKTLDTLDKLTQLYEISSLFAQKSMTVAAMKMFATEGYNHEHMLAKLQASVTKLRMFQNSDDNLRVLEDIYNSYARSNRLRFF